MTTRVLATPAFDGVALIAALDAQRAERGLDWNGLAVELHEQSAALNAKLLDHALCPGALVRTAKRGTMSCQYALILLRWLGRPPEDFLAGPVVDVGDTTLPEPGPKKRLRWDLGRLHTTLNQRRQERHLTWAELAGEFLHREPAHQPAHRAPGRHGPGDSGHPVGRPTGRGLRPSCRLVMPNLS